MGTVTSFNRLLAKRGNSPQIYSTHYKSRTGGSRPARRLTFVQSATKVSKNAFLLAEGISFASFLRHPITSELNKPARYRGAFLSV